MLSYLSAIFRRQNAAGRRAGGHRYVLVTERASQEDLQREEALGYIPLFPENVTRTDEETVYSYGPGITMRIRTSNHPIGGRACHK